MTYKEVDSILRKDGWVLAVRRGDICLYTKEGNTFSASVPNHGKKDISIGVIKDLERGTGLSFRR